MSENGKIEYLKKHNMTAIETEEGIIGGYKKDRKKKIKGHRAKICQNLV